MRDDYHFDTGRRGGLSLRKPSALAVLLIFVSMLVLAVPSYANPSPDLLAVDSAFVNGQYEKVELLGLRILQGPDSLTNDERARLNLTCGYSLIMLGRENEARTYFNHALDAVPDLALDPVQVSPKFRVVFDEVKAARRDEGGGMRDEEKILSQPPGIMRPTMHSRAMFANLIVPGSGQWMEGHKVRGAVFFAVQAAAVGVFAWQVNRTEESHENYLAETDPARIAHAYDNYNRDYGWAWASGITMGLVYVAAQADLVRIESLSANRTSWQVVPHGAGLAVRW